MPRDDENLEDHVRNRVFWLDQQLPHGVLAQRPGQMPLRLHDRGVSALPAEHPHDEGLGTLQITQVHGEEPVLRREAPQGPGQGAQPCRGGGWQPTPTDARCAPGRRPSVDGATGAWGRPVPRRRGGRGMLPIARILPGLVLVWLSACGDPSPTCEEVVERLCNAGAACTSDPSVRIHVDQVGTATYSDAEFCFDQIGARVCVDPALADRVLQCAEVYDASTCDAAAAQDRALQLTAACGSHLLGGS